MTTQQASSAQREPSMEEILASIRRIIEDGDAVRKQADEAAQPAAPASVSVEPAARPRAPVIDVDAFRAELRGRLETPAETAPAPVDQPATVALPDTARAAIKPRTLADVQAEIMRGTRGAEPAAAPAAIPSQPEREIPPQSVQGEAVVDAAVVVPAAVDDVFVERPSSRVIAAFGDDESVAPPVAAETDPPVFEPEPDFVAQEAPKPAIISPHAGRQVAAAFGELSEAFAESRKRSFDEMAEQMLRPMLQDWLDNNLPVLVERLVREEIERVARGD